MQKSNWSVYALELAAKGAPPRADVRGPAPRPAPPSELSFNRFRAPHSLRMLGAACAEDLVQRHRGLAQELVDADERAVHGGEH